MDNKTFVSCIGLLQSIFGQANPELIKYLRGKFKDTPDDLFESACSKIADTFKPTSQTPFPLPAHFNDAMGLGGQNRAVLAVSAVKKAGSLVGIYNSVSFGDRAIHEAINSFGGWLVVACWGDEEWKFMEKKFMDCYNAHASTGRGPDHLAGKNELSYSEKIMTIPEDRRVSFEQGIKPVPVSWSGYTELQISAPEVKKEIEYTGEVASMNEILKSLLHSPAVGYLLETDKF